MQRLDPPSDGLIVSLLFGASYLVVGGIGGLVWVLTTRQTGGSTFAGTESPVRVASQQCALRLLAEGHSWQVNHRSLAPSVRGPDSNLIEIFEVNWVRFAKLHVKIEVLVKAPLW